MGNRFLWEYLEEVEVEEEYAGYDGYYYSVAEAIIIIVVGSLCGLRNTKQIWLWATNDKIQEFRFHLIIVVTDQHMILLYRCFVVIGIGGDAVFHFKKVIGIPIHIRFRRSGEAHQERVEILKNGALR